MQAQTNQDRKAEADRLLDRGIKARRASQYQNAILATVESTYRKLADLLLKQDRILEAQQLLDLLKVE